jgi:transcriptional regulator with XRE-family HTH domain
MSQTGLANAIGITFQQVQKYEKGREPRRLRAAGKDRRRARRAGG